MYQLRLQSGLFDSALYIFAKTKVISKACCFQNTLNKAVLLLSSGNQLSGTVVIVIA